MAEVVGLSGQWGGGEFGAEGGVAGVMPGAAVAAFAEHAAPGAAEQAPVGRGAVIVQMSLQEGDEGRRDGHAADGAFGPVLETAGLVGRTGAGPG